MQSDRNERPALEAIVSTMKNLFDKEGSLWAIITINDHGQITEILTYSDDASTQKWIEV
jgi:hypothetical protein